MTDVTDAPRRTALYRMFDAEGTLLYVGIAYSFGRRWAQEAAEKSWWPEVQRQTVEWHPSREEAHRLEVEAIQAEKPKYNIAHARAPRHPDCITDEAEPDSRRFVGFLANSEDRGCYMPDSPDLVAPGTYLVTLGYDATQYEAVTVTQCVLINPGDSVAQEYGGRIPCTCKEAAEMGALMGPMPPACRQHPPEFCEAAPAGVVLTM